MSVAENRQTVHRPPCKDEMQRAVDLVQHLREAATGDEFRYAFRELARELRNPRGECEVTMFDNDGNVLGYFEPVLARMKKRGHIAPPAASVDEFLDGSVPAEEILERLFDRTSS